jgi:uncharacterized protein YgiM (DUF1202 family)
MSLLAALVASLLMVFGVMTTSAQVGTNAVVGNAYFVNLRTGPGVAFPVAVQMTAGQAVTLIGRNFEATWVEAVLPTGTRGWFNARYAITSFVITGLPVTYNSGVVNPTPIPAQPATGNATVFANFLNLRSGPGANFDKVARLVQGQMLMLVGRNADARWVQVNVPNVGSGWVSARYIIANVVVANLPIVNNTGVTPGFQQPVPVGGQTGLVSAGALNMRMGPGVGFVSFRTLANGTGVSLIARDSTAAWLLVQLADGTTGYVSSAFISTSFPIGNLPIR